MSLGSENVETMIKILTDNNYAMFDVNGEMVEGVSNSLPDSNMLFKLK